MPILYALANQKGGVGKTTTAVSLGAYFAHWNERVLIIDIDPQANATSSLGIDKHQVSYSTYDLLVRGIPLYRTVVPTHRARLDLVPASPALAGANVELVGMPEREFRLRKALATLTDEYSYVFIDCPPSLSILTVNGLTGTQGVIVPVQCEYLSLEGLSQLTRAIELVRKALNPALTIRGLVMTMFDARTTLARQVVEEVRTHFPGKVFNSVIPRSVRLSEAPSFAEPIVSYAPQSAGALAYAALAREILLGDGKSLKETRISE
jgi:chromosome partitioning protein